MRHKIFLIAIGTIFFALTAIFLFFPRSTFSELERRELASFPEFSFESLFSGKYAADLSHWFSDSEPYRDKFMEAHLNFKDRIALRRGGEEAITFHAEAGGGADPVPGVDDGRGVQEMDGLNADGTARIASNGIIVTGSGSDVRALMMYGGGGTGHSSHAAAANRMAKAFGPKVTVYVMVIPTSIAYYCPDKVKDRTRSQPATINNIHSQLDIDVKAVDVYSYLGQHAKEDIYLRTDHHWAPLGGFYAAQKFAQVAGVPVPQLNQFDRHVLHNYVGTMYGYSKDINVKNAPEDFVYFTPKNSSYTTTYIIYQTDKDFHVTGKSAPHKGSYFHHFKDGSSAAYCTFMGTDMATVKVQTSVRNGRRLLVIKDSFGNAIPSNLFGSFEQVHVIDFRYFIGNLRSYVADNGITDVLLAFNIFNAYSGSAAAKMLRMLNGVSAETTSRSSASESKKGEKPRQETHVESGHETPAPQSTEEAPAVPQEEE